MNDFLRADSLASACAYKSGFTREWELTGLTGILQQIIFSQLASKASQFVPVFGHHSCKGTVGLLLLLGALPRLWCHFSRLAGTACFKRTTPPQAVELEWHRVLRFMGSPRVGHGWATELNWLKLAWNHSPKKLFSGCWPCVQVDCPGWQQYQLLISTVPCIQGLVLNNQLTFLRVFHS